MRFAVRGADGDAAAAVADAVRAGGGETVDDGDAADALVTVGEAALVDAALADPPAPLLPVDAAVGRHSVARSALGDAVEALRAGEGRRVDHPVLSASVNGDPAARAVMDLTLLTSDAARISEYAVETDGERLDGFRADGVVVAAPLGSAGYARDAGGPVLAGGGGVSVVPISPFATTADTWVVDGDLALTVERRCPVDLVADGREATTVDRGDRIAVRRGASVTLVRAPTGGDWKNSNER